MIAGDELSIMYDWVAIARSLAAAACVAVDKCFELAASVRAIVDWHALHGHDAGPVNENNVLGTSLAEILH